MPNYDYVCDTCEKEFEVFQSMKDERLTKCLDETCKGTVKRKLGTGAGFVFKGSGFYITDYRSDAYKASAKSDASAFSASTPTPAPAKEASKPAPAPASSNSGTGS